MLTFYDYAPSRNAWKVRQLLALLARPYRTVSVSIFEGEGRTPAFRRISPTGTVPAITLDEGRALAESAAILVFLADGSAYLPDDPFARAKVMQWLAFEQERIESTIGALRHWRLTGKLARRPAALVEVKHAAAMGALAVLDAELATRAWIAGDAFSIADIAVHAYASRAAEAGLDASPFAHFAAWCERVAAHPGYLVDTASYADDPHSTRELPATAVTAA
jgi:glutathione S-transferase